MAPRWPPAPAAARERFMMHTLCGHCAGRARPRAPTAPRPDLPRAAYYFDLPKGTFARRVAATGLLAAGGRGGSPKTALMAHTHTHTEPPYPEQG